VSRWDTLLSHLNVVRHARLTWVATLARLLSSAGVFGGTILPTSRHARELIISDRLAEYMVCDMSAGGIVLNA
jgi:hypothetical protein